MYPLKVLSSASPSTFGGEIARIATPPVALVPSDTIAANFRIKAPLYRKGWFIAQPDTSGHRLTATPPAHPRSRHVHRQGEAPPPLVASLRQHER